MMMDSDGDDGDGDGELASLLPLASEIASEEMTESPEERGPTETTMRSKTTLIAVPWRETPISKRAAVHHLNHEAGTRKLSTDRGIRVAQSKQEGRTNSDDPRFDINSDPWLVGIGTDVALLTEKNIWIGRVLRMRKRLRRGWVEYKRPVDINAMREEKQHEELEAIHITCYYYKRRQGGSQRGESRFDLKVPDWAEYTLASIISPVCMTFHEVGGYYVMDPKTAEVLRTQKRSMSDQGFNFNY